MSAKSASNWPDIFAAVSGMIILAGALVAIFKKNEPWKNDLMEINDEMIEKTREIQTAHNEEKQSNQQRMLLLESKLTDIIRQLEDIRKEIENKDIDKDKKITKLEEKMEKLTDMMINFLKEYKN